MRISDWSSDVCASDLLAGVPVPVLYAWIGFMGAAVLAPVVLIFEPGAMTGLFAIGPEAFGAVAFSAICSTLIGQGGMAWLLQRHPISTVIPLTLAAPAVTVVASALAFQTPVTGMMILGGGVVLGGVAMVTIRRDGQIPFPKHSDSSQPTRPNPL